MRTQHAGPPRPCQLPDGGRPSLWSNLPVWPFAVAPEMAAEVGSHRQAKRQTQGGDTPERWPLPRQAWAGASPHLRLPSRVPTASGGKLCACQVPGWVTVAGSHPLPGPCPRNHSTQLPAAGQASGCRLWCCKGRRLGWASRWAWAAPQHRIPSTPAPPSSAPQAQKVLRAWT